MSLNPIRSPIRFIQNVGELSRIEDFATHLALNKLDIFLAGDDAYLWMFAHEWTRGELGKILPLHTPVVNREVAYFNDFFQPLTIRACPAGRTRCAWDGPFVTCVGLRVGAPVGRKLNLYTDQPEVHAKLGKSHEVTAGRLQPSQSRRTLIRTNKVGLGSARDCGSYALSHPKAKEIPDAAFD